MVKASRLKNGLTVLEIPQKETETITVLILCRVGSRYEGRKINGASHFIEHLMFKGTKKRPTALAISKELDKIGAEYNAFTVKDRTGYYIKANHENQELALDLLSDILFNSLFPKPEIQRERGVIIEEIHMYEDNPLMYCEDLIEELTFNKKHSLGQLIIGPKANISAISRSEIIDYKNKFYCPDNMVLAIAGKINNKTKQLIKKYFNNNSANRKKTDYQKFLPYQKMPQVLLHYKDTKQIQLGLSFVGLGLGHQDLPALNLLSIIFGGNMSSRLFINIREKKGLCYFIKACLSTYQDTGIFYIQSGLDKSRLEEAIAAILNELWKVIDRGVTEEELKNAKTFLKGKISLDLEDSSAQADWYANQKLLIDQLKTPGEKLRQYQKVSCQDIKRIAKAVFDINRINMVLIGPFRNKDKFYKILKYAKQQSPAN